MRAAPTLPNDFLQIVAWPDEVIDAVGHDPRAKYVERYWLSVLGPSTTLLLRYFADELDLRPEGFKISLPETSMRLGIRMKGGKGCPFMRSLGRLVQFEMAQLHGPGVLAIRRRVPSLSHRHLVRLPESVRVEHTRWIHDQLRNVS